MSEIKIYVANLGAYNAGESKGKWFTLPVEMDVIFKAIFDPHELDENGQPHGDWAIHDYEAPFKIEEHSSIGHLNEVAEVFEFLSEEDIQIACALKDDGIIVDLTEAQGTVEDVVRYYDCDDMSDIARFVIEERYGDKEEEEYRLFLRHFDYESYGEELDTSSTYLFLDNGLAVQHLN